MLEINEKFKKLLPDLVPISFRELEASILKNGLKTPIQIWKNQIVDGHNRYEICQKHNIPYEVEELFFPDEDKACEWMLRNQLGRRNLTPQQQFICIGSLYNLRKKAVGAPINNKNAVDGSEDENKLDTMSNLNSETIKTTAQAIAEEQGVNERTVRRAGKVVKAFEQVDEETKNGFLNGDITQKDLIEVAKTESKDSDVENTPKEYSAGKNAETEFMCFQGYRLEKLINNFKKKLNEITMAKPPTHSIPEPLAQLYEQAEEICISINNACNDVRNQFICEYCGGMVCENCTGGYVSVQTRCFQVAKVKENPSLRGQFKKTDEVITELYS